MNPSQILRIEDLEQGLTAPRFLLFKHSHRCGISDRAFKQYTRFCAGHDDMPTGWIDVVAQREWSSEIERRTGIAHASPQALWIRDGKVEWHASHGDITVDSLTGAVVS